MNTELISRITEEVKHIHPGIEHVGRDLEELISHLKNPDDHLQHLVGTDEWMNSLLSVYRVDQLVPIFYNSSDRYNVPHVTRRS